MIDCNDIIYYKNKRCVTDTKRGIFNLVLLFFHMYHCGLCKPDTFVYVKQMQGEAQLCLLEPYFFNHGHDL